ncbi:MAG: TMEM175 family protein [Chitinophagaceae bacterium]
MNNELQSELKKEFQLERMILFSDAVFAIAITLLVIEIKVPEIARELVTEHRLAQSLAHMIPKFVGFIISFMIIWLYWTVHHRMFGFVVNYNQRLLWLNLIFLLAVVLMPFSTAFWSEYISLLLNSPMIMYVSNICFLGFMNFFLWRYISNPKNKLTAGLSKPVAAYFSFRAIMIPIIFLVMALVYFFIDKKYAIWIPQFIPVIMWLVTRRYKKKLNTSNNKL